ncbi:unnamed protein product, partial [Didymodactylos carnosus]
MENCRPTYLLWQDKFETFSRRLFGVYEYINPNKIEFQFWDDYYERWLDLTERSFDNIKLKYLSERNGAITSQRAILKCRIIIKSDFGQSQEQDLKASTNIVDSITTAIEENISDTVFLNVSKIINDHEENDELQTLNQDDMKLPNTENINHENFLDNLDLLYVHGTYPPSIEAPSLPIVSHNQQPQADDINEYGQANSDNDRKERLFMKSDVKKQQGKKYERDIYPERYKKLPVKIAVVADNHSLDKIKEPLIQITENYDLNRSKDLQPLPRIPSPIKSIKAVEPYFIFVIARKSVLDWNTACESNTMVI